MAHAELNVAEPDPRLAVILETTWNEKPLVEMVPGTRYVDGRWRAPLSWASAVTLRGVFGPRFTYGPLLNRWLTDERASRVDPSMFLRDRTEWPTEWPELRPGTFAEPDDGDRLRPFQVVGATWLMIAGAAVLGDDMGTGKTVQILSALYGLRDALPALVVCPNGVKRHWARLARKWCPTAEPYVVSGTATQRAKVIAAARLDPAALVIVNIESARLFSRLAPYGSVKLKRCKVCDKRYGEEIKPSRCEVHPKELNEFPFRSIVLDEAHHLQNPASKWTRAVWALAHNPSIVYRFGATGTVIGNDPGDLWSIYHALCPIEYPVKSKWMDRYALMSWNAGGGTSVVGLRPDTRDELFRYFDPRFRRMSQDRVLTQLPPLVRYTRTVSMTTQQARMYRELAGRLVTRTDDGQLLVAPDDLVAQTRLMQLAAGSVDVEAVDPDDVSSWKVHIREPSPKIDELEKIVLELGTNTFVVASEFKDLVALASARLIKLGVRHGFLTGDQSEYDRDQQLQLLREGKIQALLFTIKAGSEGHDMSVASYLIALQRSWRMINDLQMERRVYRFGSTIHRQVTVIDVVTEDTVEETQVQRLYEKRERLEEINRDRQARVAAGLDTSDLDAEAIEIGMTYLGAPTVEATTT